MVFSYLYAFKEGDWKIPHSLALFEESDVLCVANREGQKIDCMKAGIDRPLYANRDETGQKVTTYKGVGRPYAIDGKGETNISNPNQTFLSANYSKIDLIVCILYA